VDYVIYMIAN